MQRTVLARRVGVAENTIYRIETGKRTPSVELLDKIAHELRTEPADLLKEPVPLADPARSPHIEDADIARQSQSGTGYAKLAHWHDTVDDFVRTRRAEQDQRLVVVPEGWHIPSGVGTGEPTRQGFSAFNLEDPKIYEAWVATVRQAEMTLRDEMEEVGVMRLVDALRAKNAGRLEGESLENYSEAFNLLAALSDLQKLVDDIEREDVKRRVSRPKDEAERELRKLMLFPIQGGRSA